MEIHLYFTVLTNNCELLNQGIWTTTPRGIVNQELKLSTMHLLMIKGGKNLSVLSSKGLGLVTTPMNVLIIMSTLYFTYFTIDALFRVQ